MTRSENKKPTVGLIAEVGCLRCDLSFAYRAVSPHSGALFQQQQMQAPILIRWLTGRFLSYNGVRESQFGQRRRSVGVSPALFQSGRMQKNCRRYNTPS
jgi:hypothetical protein